MSSLAVASYTELQEMAKAFAASGYFRDARDAAQAYVKILAGREWGLGPMAAMTGIFIVDGKPTMAAVTIAGCIKKSGRYDYAILEHTPDVCEIEFFERENGVKTSLGKSRFSKEDATTAGLLSNPTYRKYPRNMMFSRALTNGARWHTPDVFGGAVYTPDELDNKIELDDEGKPVMKTPTPLAPVAPTAALPAAPVEPQREPLGIKALNALFKDAVTAGVVKPLKFGVWLEVENIAPELSSRKDGDGKQLGLTPEEAIIAQDRLERLLAEGVIVAEPEPAQAPAPQAPAPPVEEATGITNGQRLRIMAMFNGAGIKKDEDRHAYAERILGPGKGSTATWTASDYSRISDALEGKP